MSKWPNFADLVEFAARAALKQTEIPENISAIGGGPAVVTYTTTSPFTRLGWIMPTPPSGGVFDLE